MRIIGLNIRVNNREACNESYHADIPEQKQTLQASVSKQDCSYSVGNAPQNNVEQTDKVSVTNPSAVSQAQTFLRFAINKCSGT